ncbi:DUF624 domain-containing protein [uncultured Actinomyces sp.]|uniref:DUF624 domain-containing protein n=1 Tax=uncultured Actinomyces sp. TaxID=249061 RepID=UPI0025E7CA44|nr:DUF624 domain-containing protein [uncultured Actinomyces sp.]
MALFPGPDSPAYRAWSAAADVVILNALTLAGCLPVVTAGASLTACARVAGEMAADDDPAVAATWWRSFRLNLRQSLAWWLPVLVLLALGVWEYLLLADGAAMGHQTGGQHGVGGRMSGAVSGLVLAGGVLLVSTLIWLLPLAAFFDAPLTRHLSNAARLAVGRLGITALALVIATAPVAVLWTVPAMRTAALWFLVLIGPAFQTYLIALLQRSTVAGLTAAAPAPS